MAWFLVGFTVYLLPEYYHQAYSLEAFLGLGYMAACCTPLLARAVFAAARSLLSVGGPVRWIALTAAAVIVVLCAVAVLMVAPRVLSSGRAAVTGLVDTNRTFEQSVAFLSSLEAGDATVLAFSDKQRGLFAEDWRNRGLVCCATVVPVMDLPQLQDLLEALGGPGMTVEPFAAPGDATVPSGRPLYGLAFREAERRDMLESWIATPVARITNGEATSTAFRLQEATSVKVVYERLRSIRSSDAQLAMS